MAITWDVQKSQTVAPPYFSPRRTKVPPNMLLIHIRLENEKAFQGMLLQLRQGRWVAFEKACWAVSPLLQDALGAATIQHPSTAHETEGREWI